MTAKFGERAQLPMDQVGGIAPNVRNAGGSTPAFSIAGGPLPATGNVSVAYGPVTFRGVGGQAPYLFSVHAGLLPTGVTLDALTGIVGGTPTTAQTRAGVSIRATDALGETGDSTPVTIVISP